MRWAPIPVALLFLGAALLWIYNDASFRRGGYPVGSSLSTAPQGLSLARGYLQERGTEVATLSRPLSPGAVAPDAVVFRVSPGFLFAITSPDGGQPDGGSLVQVFEDDEEDDDEDEANSADTADADGGGVQAPGPLAAREADGGVSAEDADGGLAALRLTWSRRDVLTEDEERFVASGGRLVLAVQRPYRSLNVEPASLEPLQRVFPALPGVQRLEPEPELGLAGRGLARAVAVFERGGSPVVARQSLGKGDVWLLSSPDVFSNAHLAHADNLALLVGLAGNARPVLFDEGAHGLVDEPGVLELLRRFGLGPVLLLLAVLFLAWFWRRAVVLGPPEFWQDSRTESVDLVHALALLYQRALRPQDLLTLHRSRLVHDIQLRLGLSPAAAEERAQELTEGWEPPVGFKLLGRSDFQRHLDILNRAFRRLRDDKPHRA